jgi:DHA3 family tetracycline resistance protein-like MFS transporter
MALFLALFMPEIGFQPIPQPERSTWGKMGDTFREGVGVVRGSSILMVVVGITLFFGLASEGRDRLWEAQMLENVPFPTPGSFDTVFWFGVIAVVGLALGLVTTEFIRRRIKTEKQTAAIRIQFVLTTVVIGSIVLFGVAQSFLLAATMIMLNSVMRGANHTISSAWINKELTSKARATVLSMLGQIDAVGQILGGILMGVIANVLGLRAAMIGVGLLLLPTLLLYRLAHRVTTQRDQLAAIDSAEIN